MAIRDGPDLLAARLVPPAPSCLRSSRFSISAVAPLIPVFGRCHDGSADRRPAQPGRPPQLAGPKPLRFCPLCALKSPPPRSLDWPRVAIGNRPMGGKGWRAIAKAHGLNLGRLVSEVKAAHEAIEAKGRLDAKEDLAATSPLEAVQ